MGQGWIFTQNPPGKVPHFKIEQAQIDGARLANMLQDRFGSQAGDNNRINVRGHVGWVGTKAALYVDACAWDHSEGLVVRYFADNSRQLFRLGTDIGSVVIHQKLESNNNQVVFFCPVRVSNIDLVFYFSDLDVGEEKEIFSAKWEQAVNMLWQTARAQPQ
ncbi:MAG: hypothetical protein ACOY94_06395 [Bacillota bacterium]